MKLPPAYEVQQKFMAKNQREIRKNLAASDDEQEEPEQELMRANISKRDRLYDEYMSELTKYEMDVLYTAYYGDFKAFGYCPCEEL